MDVKGRPESRDDPELSDKTNSPGAAAIRLQVQMTELISGIDSAIKRYNRTPNRPSLNSPE